MDQVMAGLLDFLVATVARGFQSDPSAVRESLEMALRRVPGVAEVQIAVALPGLESTMTGPHVVRVPIPGLDETVGIQVRLLTGAGSRRVEEFFRRVAVIIAPVVHAERLVSAAGAPARSAGRCLVGSSAVMGALRERIARVARTDFSVVIEGESGVGKELVAKQIHELSKRRSGPFVAVNCAAIVDSLVETELFGIEDRTATGVKGRRGKFEAADGGTLFLDEVADLSLAAQAKLLRVLQEWAVERVGGNVSHHVDVRVMVATNKGLASLVDQGRFRNDLFYRLASLEISVPPLRARLEDLNELVPTILGRHRRPGSLQLTPAATDALLSYEWPGNVRELERVLERAIALTDAATIDVRDLPPSIARRYRETLEPSLANRDTLRAWGARYAKLVLGRCGNNKRLACRWLDISYHTLQGYLDYVGPAERDAQAIESTPSEGRV
jgi:transcriptional regulator with PAS, ATPase and Fis domain